MLAKANACGLKAALTQSSIKRWAAHTQLSMLMNPLELPIAPCSRAKHQTLSGELYQQLSSPTVMGTCSLRPTPNVPLSP